MSTSMTADELTIKLLRKENARLADIIEAQRLEINGLRIDDARTMRENDALKSENRKLLVENMRLKKFHDESA